MRSSATPKLLMITHRAPWPADRGDRIRTWNLLKGLSGRFQIHLACLVDEPIHLQAWKTLASVTAALAIEPVGGPMRWLRGLASAAAGRSITRGMFHAPALQRTLTEWAADHAFDAGLAVCSSTAHYLADLPIPVKVMDLVDVDSVKWAQLAAVAGPGKSGVYALESRRIAECERRIAADFSAVTVVTAREAELFEQVSGRPACVVPNGVDGDYFAPTGEPKDENSLVFTGVLDYAPNVQGLLWFVQEVWPGLIARRPAARLNIVGRDPAPAIRRLHGLPGINVVGPVPDVRHWLNRAQLAVTPIQIARGVQNKALEAMACGLPVITTPQVAAGLTATPGTHFLTATAPLQWVHAIDLLLNQPHLARSMGDLARQHVLTHHQWDQSATLLASLLQPAAESLPTPIPMPDRKMAA